MNTKLHIALVIAAIGFFAGCQEEAPQPRSKGDDVLLKFNSGNGEAASRYSSQKDEKK